jgi:hypothetical protein
MGVWVDSRLISVQTSIRDILAGKLCCIGYDWQNGPRLRFISQPRLDHRRVPAKMHHRWLFDRDRSTINQRLQMRNRGRAF